jgi:hypothetical protein
VISVQYCSKICDLTNVILTNSLKINSVASEYEDDNVNIIMYLHNAIITIGIFFVTKTFCEY